VCRLHRHHLRLAPGIGKGNGQAWTSDSFLGLLESWPDAIVMADTEGKIVLVNAKATALFGYGPDELAGQSVEVLVPERYRAGYAEHGAAYLAAPQPLTAEREFYARRKDGSEFTVEISLNPFEIADGPFIVSVIRDVTERRRHERAARQFIAVVESSSDAIIGKDLDGIVVLWNPGAEALYGYTEAEMLGRSISVLLAPGHDDEMPDLMRRVRAGDRIDHHETVRARKDGIQVNVSVTISPIFDDEHTVVGMATIARDISARLRYQEQLRFLAEHDALTGAANRRRFEREVTNQVGRARRYGEQAVLLLIDVDDFKAVNDTHGHRAGDRALKAVAMAISARLRATDTVARIGGDEFAALLPYAGAAQAIAVADDLRRVIGAAGVDVGGTTVALSVSIGVALINAQTESDEAVLADADRAMYEDKARSPRSRSGRAAQHEDRHVVAQRAIDALDSEREAGDEGPRGRVADP
jgi:diguanylate cyclase (GGDEF)-like protein/PAS domain S-box-containing protein